MPDYDSCERNKSCSKPVDDETLAVVVTATIIASRIGVASSSVYVWEY